MGLYEFLGRGSFQLPVAGRQRMKQFLVILFCSLLSLCHCHVSLTFPPARRPAYDFLDNVRTGGPCGVPPGRLQYELYILNFFLSCILFIDSRSDAVVTTFATGTRFNVTFRLAYPHQVSKDIFAVSLHHLLLYFREEFLLISSMSMVA